MPAQRTSTVKTVWGQMMRTLKPAVHGATALAARLVRSGFPKAFVWCRDHVLSLAVLLMFPVAIAAFYWSHSTSEQNVPPGYLRVDRDEKSASETTETATDVEPQLVSVIPQTPPFAEEPQNGGFPTEFGGAEFSAPQLLPVSGEGPEMLPPTEQDASRSWNMGGPAESQSGMSSMRCVWLTGTIEEPENATEHLQNASRVHELTFPGRN